MNLVQTFSRLVGSLALTLGCLVVLVACGANSSGTSNAATAAGTCTSGYVYSSVYGCLPQSTCASGYVLYNNTCIAVATTSTLCPTGYTLLSNQCVLTATTVATTTNSCQGTCPAGYTQTSYGCLPQYRCGSCFGYAQGYCVAPTGYSYYLGY